MNKHLFENHLTEAEITLENFEEMERERNYYSGKVDHAMVRLEQLVLGLYADVPLQDAALQIMYELDEARANAFFNAHRGDL
ncbi:hypothetical protein [Massilia sp. NP310]|uniref:hypothetical protein n=1 Tax=Massilia sp. NP310 TaxID=2861282 RepID=UPI001C63767A|nr:hypothetical protein [Massilia sp. NP310]QYG02236.1 hypothetical protein KY496_01965 [Massilia sp. NP310]